MRLAMTENHKLQKELLELLTNDDNPYVQQHAKRALEVVRLEAELQNSSFYHRDGTEARLGELIIAAGILNEKLMHAFVDMAKKK